jgi:cation diffusion facilitator family transporter
LTCKLFCQVSELDGEKTNSMEQMISKELQIEEKKKIALSSFLAAVGLVATKLTVGILTQSLGIISEALHSALDLCAAGVTYFTVKVSDKPADFEHHYGHSKSESFSALVEVVLLFVTAGWIIYEALHRMLFHIVKLEVNFLSFAVMILSIIVNFSRAGALDKVAQKYHSQALEADALHFKSDIWSSLAVILGLILVLLGFAIADPLAALGVAFLVIWASVKLGKKTVDVLLDRAPVGVRQKIFEVVEKIEGVTDCTRLRIRGSGKEIFVDMNISLDRTTPFPQAHKIAQEIEEKVSSIIPGADVVVHTDPVDARNFVDHKIDLSPYSDEELKKEQMVSSIINEHIKDFVEFHDLTFRKSGSLQLINLHLVLPKDMHIEEAHRLCDHLEEDIKKQLGKSEIIIHVEPCDGECDFCHKECGRS